MRRWWQATVWTIAALGAASGCIVPDTGIDARGESVNPGPVRLIQATALSKQVNDECNAFPGLAECPLVPLTQPFGLLRPEVVGVEFCVCPEVDGNALNFFDIYVEDPDLDKGRPRDSILGAFLLDLPSGADDPSSYVAYEHLLSPTTPAAPVQFGFGGSYSDAIERPTPQVRRWTIGDGQTQVDLCNDNASSPNTKLEGGLHSLRLIVTDRPWYRPFVFDDDGEIALDEDEKPKQVDADQAAIGVPDTPAGASYAIADYVFRCRVPVPVGDDPDPLCGCAAAEPEPQ